MKILYITAGAGGMYCGSCLRDNALATELLAMGHDCILLPVYTPTLTDEENVSQDKVFLGGISVYLQQHMSFFRKTPWMLDRLWDSSLALRLASRGSISVDPAGLGELTISMLKGEDGFHAKELDKLVHWLRSEPAPDIVNIPNALLISMAKPIRNALGRPICCTLQGEDFFLEGLPEKDRREALDLIRANVQYVDSFIAVSRYYGDFTAEYLSIPREKINVVPLGINLTGYEQAVSAAREVFTVGYMARVAPEKGLHLLVDAYRRFRKQSSSHPARLEVAGYLAPQHKDYLAGIQRQMTEWGLAEEFTYRGVLDRTQKIQFLQSLSVLSVPTIFDDAKGIFVLEAMACGVPVVQPRRGAFTEMIQDTSGGILVEPDDADSLADAFLSLLHDPKLAGELGRNGHRAVREGYTARGMATRALEVYGSVIESRSAACLEPAGYGSGGR
jgi:glycosyltransferase involved in cell wall biosynthesis